MNSPARATGAGVRTSAQPALGNGTDPSGIAAIGKGGVIYGWIDPASVHREVAVSVNGLNVASTQAGRDVVLGGHTVPAAFRFSVGELWSLLGEGDRLEVKCGGIRLPISGEGMQFSRFNAQPSRFGELRRRIEAGEVFNKYGKLSPTLASNRQWQHAMQRIYDAMNEVLQREFNRPAFVIYGTLLGAIREKAFIKNDDDFDVAFLVNGQRPQEVWDDVRAVALALSVGGLMVRVHMSRMLMRVSIPGRRPYLDFYYAWFNEEGAFDICVGYHGRPFHSSPEEFSVVPCQLEQLRVFVPKDAEAILEQLYGSGWRVPDQGFSHMVKTRKLSREYILDSDTAQRIYWNNYYSHRDCPPGSSFAEHVAARFEKGSVIAEFGCGNGRDSLFLARAGLRVFGNDRSRAAILSARKALEASGLQNCSFSIVDVSHAADIEAVFADSAMVEALNSAEKLVIYLRFFLHAVPEEVERTLFTAIRRSLSRPYWVAAEFRTDRDEGAKKAHGNDHYRRYIKPDDMVERMKREYGLTIESIESGYGLSVYKDEDPHLCRIVAYRVPGGQTPIA